MSIWAVGTRVDLNFINLEIVDSRWKEGWLGSRVGGRDAVVQLG